MGISAPSVFMTAYPNPFSDNNTIKYRVENATHVTILLFDLDGRLVKTLLDASQSEGDYTINWNSGNLSNGTYFARAMQGDHILQTLKLVKTN